MTKIKQVLVYGFVLGASFGCSSALAQPTLPDFSAATFASGQPIDNQYFPLNEGLKRIYEGERIDGDETILESFKLKTLGPGPVILGVQTITQRERSFEDGVLVEDTLDYFAQDTAGNVWYFGEDVTNFLYDDMGDPAGTNSEGSWRAGVNGGLPGLIMPADLTIGFNYYQEFSPAADAVDQGTTSAVDEMVSIDLGSFSNVLKVLETTALEPGFMELKYYAPGRGLVLVEEGVNADLMDPEITFELVRVKTKGGGNGNDGGGNDGDDSATTASSLSLDSELATMIEQAVNAAYSSDGATLSAQVDSDALATWILKGTEPNFRASKLLAFGASVSGAARSLSAVPEPSAWILVALTLLSTRARRLRTIS